MTDRFTHGCRLARRLLTRGRLAGLAAAALVVFLVGLHGVLLWQRLTDLSLLEPAVALRWLLSALLLVALMRLHRLGVPLVWGRRALIFWFVVLLLHAAGPAGVSGIGGEVPLLALPAQVAVALLVLLALLALGRQGIGRDPEPLANGRPRPRPSRSVPGPHSAFFPALFSQPPPA